MITASKEERTWQLVMHLLAVFRNGFQENFKTEICSIWSSGTQITSKAGFPVRWNHMIKERWKPECHVWEMKEINAKV